MEKKKSGPYQCTGLITSTNTESLLLPKTFVVMESTDLKTSKIPSHFEGVEKLYSSYALFPKLLLCGQ